MTIVIKIIKVNNKSSDDDNNRKGKIRITVKSNTCSKFITNKKSNVLGLDVDLMWLLPTLKSICQNAMLHSCENSKGYPIFLVLIM